MGKARKERINEGKIRDISMKGKKMKRERRGEPHGVEKDMIEKKGRKTESVRGRIEENKR